MKPGALGLRLLSLFLVVAIGSTGCRSFLRDQALKDYRVKVKPVAGLPAPNPYQADFLYLKTLGEEVVPLEDRYFPPDKRAAMEEEILGQLGRPDCSYETFVLSLESYLRAFNNQHACIVDNPRPIHFSRLYPFKAHYVSNEVFVSDVAREYDSGLIGQKITAINDQPISAVEEKMCRFARGENLWMKRCSLEPFGYSRPDYYRLAGLASSVSNRVKVDFAGHPPVWIAPVEKENVKWSNVSHLLHPITASDGHSYACRIFAEQKLAYFQFNACFDKTAILDGLHMVNPWVRPLVRAWLGFEFHRKEPAAVLRGIYDPDRPVFKDYLDLSIRNMNRQGVTNLIIDLRHNGGGERELVYQLLYYLTRRNDLRDSRVFEYNPDVYSYYDPEGGKKFRSWYVKRFGAAPPSGRLLPTEEQEQPFFERETNRASPYYVAPSRPVFDGKIIVLANQGTESAASFLAGLIQDNRLAVIVGTTTGNNPTGPTAMTPFKLPHSGIMVSLPTEYCERAQPSNGDLLQPDYWVEDSMTDLQTGRDAAFEKALELLDPGLERVGPLKDMQVAGKVLRDLKEQNKMPGWSKDEHGMLFLPQVQPNSVTFAIQKGRGSSIYHYTMARASKDSPWRLRAAWRTDLHDHTIEEYPVP